MPWITNCVTGGQRGDAHLSRSNEGAAVANGAPFRNIADERNSCFPCHCRFEKFLKFRQGRNPVEHDASTDDIEERVRESEHARALQHMRFEISGSRVAQLLHDLAEPYNLIACVLRVFMRHREMRLNTVNLYVRQARDFFENLQGFAFGDTH